MGRPIGRVFLALAACITLAGGAAADDFYQGKSVTLIVSTGVGGGYDAYARSFARHFGSHLSGAPNVIVQNMPGGGGLRATNYLYNAAPKDGTVVGLVHSSAVFAPLLGMDGGKFDAVRFNWMGSIDKEVNFCTAWHASPIKSFDDIFTKEYVVGGTGAGGQLETYPRLLNAFFGTHFKIVSGYKGGSDVDLAMERGEVTGRCGVAMSALRSSKPEWLAQKKIRFIVQTSLESDPDLKDVPVIVERADTPEKRALLELVFADQGMLRPILAPPDLPAERVRMLREAFKSLMQDGAFLAELAKQGLGARAVSGDDVAALVARVYPSALMRTPAYV